MYIPVNLQRSIHRQYSPSILVSISIDVFIASTEHIMFWLKNIRFYQHIAITHSCD